MPVTIDKFEYQTNKAAQTSWASNSTANNCATGGTASAAFYYQTSLPSKAFDGNDTTYWENYTQVPQVPTWLKYDFGDGNAKIIFMYKILVHATYYPTAWKLQGSNDDVNWDDLDSQSGQVLTDNVRHSYGCENADAYRYYRLYITAAATEDIVVNELELIDSSAMALLAYTDAAILQAGTYSLKFIAKETDSLSKTLTRTVSPTINLTDQSKIKLWLRASCTGSNFKIGFHDSGGTTTEITPNILSADTFQEVTVDLSSVSNANKDAIDSIVITILNADTDNTVNIDYCMGYAPGEILDVKYVYSTQIQTDGTQGTLNASTIASAKGSGVNLSEEILKSGEIVDDITGTYAGGSAGGGPIMGGTILR